MKLLNLESENKFGIYFSIFRVFVCFHLLKKIFLQWDYLPILYSNDSFIAHSETSNFFSFVFDNHWLRDNYTIFLGVYVYNAFVSSFIHLFNIAVTSFGTVKFLAVPPLLLVFFVQVVFFITGYLSFLYEIGRD